MATDGLAELDALRYSLDEAHRRAGNLARNNNPVLKEFGRSTHTNLRDLLKSLERTDEAVRRGQEVSVETIEHERFPCHTITGE